MALLKILIGPVVSPAFSMLKKDSYFVPLELVKLLDSLVKSGSMSGVLIPKWGLIFLCGVVERLLILYVL